MPRGSPQGNGVKLPPSPGCPEVIFMFSAEPDVSVLLAEFAAVSQTAAEKLVPLVYEELKRLARHHMRRERPDHTLQTTALGHGAYLKFVRQDGVSWQGRSHFLGVASQLMR